MRRLTCTLLASVALLGTTAAGAPGLGLWQAATELGDGPEVSVRGDLVTHWLSALSTGIQVDDATAQWLEDLRDAMLELDLNRTWRRLPDPVGQERRVHVTGRNHGTDGYQLTLGARGADRRYTLGDIDGRAGLTPHPWEGAPAFSSSGVLSLTTHPIGHPELRSVVAALAIALEDAARSTSGDATDDALRRRVRADFPATTAALDRVVTFERWGRRLDSDVLQIDLVARIDATRIEKAGYPALAKFVRRMIDVADLSLTIRSEHGELGTIWARSPGQFGIRFATQAGAVVPLAGGTPVLAHRIDIASATHARLALCPRGLIRLKGTRLSVQHWTVPLTWDVTEQTARLIADFQTLPAVDFRSDGGMGGWMVATAGNVMGLETHALRFFQSIADGPDGPGGSGSVIRLSMQPTEEHWTMDGAWQLRMLDNLVVRFAAQVLGQRVVPDDAVLTDLLEVEETVVAGLVADWHAVRDRVASAALAQGADEGAGVSGSR